MMTATRAGWTCVLGMIASLAAGAEQQPLFPFLISYDAPDNAANMSHLVDAPAGRHGFTRVENGRFVNDAGRLRLHATNLTGPANFPTHSQADKLAARLARFGINCVRLHYFDAEYGNFMTPKEAGIFGTNDKLPAAFSADPAAPMPAFAPEAVDRQDYLIAALKKHGVYVNINLHVARFPKGLGFFDPLMIASEKAYARALLTRVNPYTGLSYTADPCVAVVEINNENALINNYLGGALDRLTGRLADEFRRQWNAWLERKYDSGEALRTAWAWRPVPLGDERIAEGAFDGPVAFDGQRWILDPGTAEVTVAASDGALRVTVTRDGSERFPKIYRRVSIEKDQPYTVSFRVRQVAGEPAPDLGFAVARTRGGWQSLGLVAPYRVGAQWKTIHHTFLATETTDLAEIQFTRFKIGEYEIDDLSFKPGATGAFGDSTGVELGAAPVVSSREYAPEQARRDFYQFLIDTERAYWTGIAAYLKNELKLRAPISGTQVCGYSPPMLQAELDYVDNHAYWCHPSVHTRWEIRNLAMVNSMSCILTLAGQRVAGKPYTVSEYNHPFPNQFGAEGQPMLRAYGALQGWDGVFEYTYNHSPDFEPRRNIYFFSMIARTDVLAHLPACAAIFLRGDVRAAHQSVTGALSPSNYFDRLVRQRSVAASIASVGLDGRLPLVHKTAMDFSDEPDAAVADAVKPDDKIVTSDTGELVWNRELAGKAYWTVNTANTKLFSGFPEGREIAMGDVKLRIGQTRLGWATVSLTSRHATGFGERGVPATILLAATGMTENEGTVLEATGEDAVALADRLDWGEGTVLTEGVPATVTLACDPARTACFALDERGERKGQVPIVPVPGGSQIEIGPQYRTVWYELAISGDPPRPAGTKGRRRNTQG